MTPEDSEALRLAADAQTAPARLRELATHGEREVRRLVASNPSAPSEVLFALIDPFGDEVQGNPAVLLYRLTDPAWLLQAPDQLRYAWMRRRPVHLWVVEALVDLETNAWAQMALLDNPSCPPGLRELVCARAAVNDRLLMQLVERGRKRDCPMWLLDCFSVQKVFVLRMVAAQHMLCPAHLLERLAEEPALRGHVTTNPNCPPELLARLQPAR